MTARPERIGREEDDGVFMFTDRDPETRFLRGLSLATNWARIKIWGGLTDSESNARQRMRKAGFAEHRHGLWRITEAGRTALAKAESFP